MPGAPSIVWPGAPNVVSDRSYELMISCVRLRGLELGQVLLQVLDADLWEAELRAWRGVLPSASGMPVAGPFETSRTVPNLRDKGSGLEHSSQNPMSNLKHQKNRRAMLTESSR